MKDLDSESFMLLFTHSLVICGLWSRCLIIYCFLLLAYNSGLNIQIHAALIGLDCDVLVKKVTEPHGIRT